MQFKKYHEPSNIINKSGLLYFQQSQAINQFNIVLFALRHAGSKCSTHSRRAPAAVPHTQRASQVARALFHHCFCTAEPDMDTQIKTKFTQENKINYQRNCFGGLVQIAPDGIGNRQVIQHGRLCSLLTDWFKTS